MSPDFLSQLRAHRTEIETRWLTLLKLEPVTTVLANPETLQFFIPQMWEQIVAAANKLQHRPISLDATKPRVPACHCGHNPYRAFFVAAERAFSEAAVLIQAAQSTDARSHGDVLELVYVIRVCARSEIDTFCSACVHRGVARGCRFSPSGSNEEAFHDPAKI